ncbi:hypothetical protein HMPREF0872_03985 [Veillonella montpellierensis DNF00314]|uniref:Uncharacterized protein n=1 Tax=Veillonella montpellierensis DNF00314 TaxID=1401067 RepID=A0A096BXU5_9FIRM|nr:hypothetical protein [Veillonella montpellierensis]KGF47562.1 hypothetical protein HMPREF0872_03985 [Veillonella montpellierensis DNF00314]
MRSIIKLHDYVEYKDKKGKTHIMYVQSIMSDKKGVIEKVGTIGIRQKWVDAKLCKVVEKPEKGVEVERG